MPHRFPRPSRKRLILSIVLTVLAIGLFVTAYAVQTYPARSDEASAHVAPVTVDPATLQAFEDDGQLGGALPSTTAATSTSMPSTIVPTTSVTSTTMSVPNTIPAPEAVPSATEETTTAPPTTVSATTTTLAPANGDVLGRVMARDGQVGALSGLIREGVGDDILDLGKDQYGDTSIGHYPGTAMPGHVGSVLLAGHRTTFTHPLYHLDAYQIGDIITVTTAEGTFQYQVREAPQIIDDPANFQIPGPGSGRNELLLIACHPLHSTKQRIVVYADLIGEPLPD